MTFTAVAAVTVFAAAYVLIATEKIHRVKVAVGGAVLMFLIGATTAEEAFFDAESGIDWNVIFLLLGMMLIVAVLRQTGIFEYVAIWSVKRARARPFRVMVILVVVTAVASAALDNVTTVLLIAPVTFLVCDRLDVPVVPYLIAEALASNIGGTATLVGDPPNIIIASRADLSYVDFLVNLAPLVVVLLLVFIVLCRFMFPHAFGFDPSRVDQIMALNEREAIRDRRLLTISLIVLSLVTLAFVAHAFVHLEPSVVALVGGLVLLGLSRLRAEDVAQDVEWPTLIFFAGLFVMVGSLVNTGADRPAVPSGDGPGRWPPGLGVHRPVVGIGRDLGSCRQHPLRRDHEPGHRGPRRGRGWRNTGAFAVVVARPRRRPRRQRHGSRSFVERDRDRARGEGRSSDHLLGIHQVRIDRRPGHDRRSHAVRAPALLRARMTTSGSGSDLETLRAPLLARFVGAGEREIVNGPTPEAGPETSDTVATEVGLVSVGVEVLAVPEVAFILVAAGLLAAAVWIAQPHLWGLGLSTAPLLAAGSTGLVLLEPTPAALVLLTLAAASLAMEVFHLPGLMLHAVGGAVALAGAGSWLLGPWSGAHPTVAVPASAVVGLGTWAAARGSWRAAATDPLAESSRLLGREVVILGVRDEHMGCAVVAGRFWTVRDPRRPLREGGLAKVTGHQGDELTVRQRRFRISID